MKKILLTLVLCVLSIQAHAAATCSSVTLGHRSYTLCAPTTPLNPAPLVVSLHPGLSQGGDGTTTGWSGAAASLNGVLTTQAETDGFYVAYPDGWGKTAALRTWNAKPGGCCAFAMETDQEDVDFIARVIADIEQTYTIDTTKEILASYSNGGMLSMTYACNHPGQIDAMAIIAGPLILETYNCPTFPAIPVTYIYGTADTTVPPAGGIGDQESYSFPATATMLSFLSTSGADMTTIALTGAGHSFADARTYLSSQESTDYQTIVGNLALPIPLRVSGLVAWFDANDPTTITSAGGAVSQWDDKSGNGNNATQATGSLQPITGTRTIGGRDVLDFDGSAVMTFDPSDLDGADGATVFVVAQSDTIVSTDRRAFQIDGDSYIAGTYRATDSVLYGTHKNDSADSFKFTTGSVAVSTNAYIQVVSNKQSGSARNYYTGSTQITSAGMSAATNTFTGGFLGDDNATGATTYDGRIAEYLIYSGELSSANKNIIGNYLADKWGIAWVNL